MTDEHYFTVLVHQSTYIAGKVWETVVSCLNMADQAS